ncbi:hypothetical protein [Undibacterium umbellatum]|uniref:Uncharacterized protein n=1 Tax=Undibacterium umbellatum TaxID=2762300 RepID=A0ABR6ZAK3_9BURK|nr:hypothetical protein [Undibacterium umbellatum]MBC3908797.1 hypothetical protein [Undibacterium umbellatum]
MRLISNEELLVVAGGDIEIDTEQLTKIDIPNVTEMLMSSINENPIMQTVEITGNRDAVERRDSIAEFSCHVISGGLGLTAGILLAETGPFVPAIAAYIIEKVDSSCVDYVKNQK